MIAVLATASLMAVCSVAAAERDLPFGPGVFSADEGCRWQPGGNDTLHMNGSFIAAPSEDGDRAAWIDALHAYRRQVREGTAQPVLRLEYNGVRAWTRMGIPVAKALAIRSGETLHIRAEARWIRGNSVLCAALDTMDSIRDVQAGWSGVLSTFDIPRDGEWHGIESDLAAPADAGVGGWVRPILGMDATHDATPGIVEIRSVQVSLKDTERMDHACTVAAGLYSARLDRSIYDRPDLAWASQIFTCHFTFLYDRSFYDPQKGFTVDAFLDEGEREFGGYDAVLLWQAYPRIGADPRNQFDFYRDLPGGLEGLRVVVRQLHERGVKAFIDYNPWDTGTRREEGSDEQALAETVAAIGADGIFLDTMTAATPSMRDTIDRARPGVAFAPEGSPPIDQLAVCSASWSQWAPDPEPPGMLQLKWIEPRHMQHQIRRWDTSHYDEIATAFFNGSGMLVWENVFGAYNPWSDGDRALWRRAVRILRAYASNFSSDAWDPFYPTARDGLFAHRWPGGDATLFTLRNMNEPLDDALLFEVKDGGDTAFFDLWNGRPARVERAGGMLRVFGSVDGLGCVVQVERKDGRVTALMEAAQRDDALAPGSPRNGMRSVVEPKPVTRTSPVEPNGSPEGMVRVPGGDVRMALSHMRRECGCYPDPGTQPEHWKEFLWGSPYDATLDHDYIAPTQPFFIDESEVTNGQFKRFLDETGYRPDHPENYLKHWPNKIMPAELADLPVVYVDLEDARAYARHVGKRLPTEAEWHLAAQGVDGRAWPWGNEFDPARCCGLGTGPMPVRSLPEGRSPFGCYHMAGNVWEWTESERDDGHTRFAIIRGGSWFEAEGSIWYVPGGPQPCTSHAKFLLLWPGLDRCATIGFRCARDAGPMAP